jgi:hypothetical protein
MGKPKTNNSKIDYIDLYLINYDNILRNQLAWRNANLLKAS